MTGWWRRRSLRARLTIVSTVVFALGLVIGTIVLAAAFAASRIGTLDKAATAQAREIAALVQGGALPDPLPVGSGQSAQVITAADGVLATSSDSTKTLPLVGTSTLRGLAGESGTTDIALVAGSVPARVAVVQTTYDNQTVYAVVGASLADEQATVRSLGRGEHIVVPLLVVIVAGASWLLLGRALGAMDALGTAASRVTDPLSAERLPVPDSADEVHGLAITLNAMLDRLADAARRERTFVDDAAHELRSPLASARLQLEVAGAHPEGQDWPAVVEESIADLDRLNALLSDLLALARMDAGVARRHMPLDLAELAGVPEQGPVPVVGDAPSLRRAVENLVANASRHGTRFEVGAAVTPGGAEVWVDDDGPGIPEADRERVFERFARLDDARGRDAGGTGLGLAIVRGTARAHGGDAYAAGSPLGGARVGMRLPLG